MPASFQYQRRKPEENLLYQTLAQNLNTFLGKLSEEGRSLPPHVEKELWAYLKCGVLAYGFVRTKCNDCSKERLVAFSCKKRGFCPSCGSKRMAEVASHLVDNIIPFSRIRQYVLSVPLPLRYWMASNKKLTGKVHRIMAEVIDTYYQKLSGKENVASGSVAFVQKFGSALNLNVHFHLLQVEGVYETRTTGAKYKKINPPTNQDIAEIVETISGKVIKLLRKEGYLSTENNLEDKQDSLLLDEPTYPECMSASVKHRIALGDRTGKRVRFIGSGFGYEGEATEFKGERCAMVNGFSLHANVSIPRHRRDQLERLIRYTARSSLSLDRLKQNENGLISYELKKKWSNGVTHVLLSPLELIEKLCSLVPLPYLHLVRYWGVLAPHSKLRKHVIPGKTRAQIKAEQQDDENDNTSRVQNKTWARMLARVFSIDVAICDKCGGEMKVIAAITDQVIVEKILKCIGENPRPPPISSARSTTIFYSA